MELTRRTLSTLPLNNNRHEEAFVNTTPFLLADIGEGIADVEVLQWFVAPGDTVRQFDTICQVQSDKATVEITSRYDGVVHSVAPHNIVKVGEPLLHIVLPSDHNHAERPSIPTTPATKGEQNTTSQPLTSAHKTPAESGSDQDTISQTKCLASPAVRKIAKENKVDLALINGTGRDGRVLKSDVIPLLETDKHCPDRQSVHTPTLTGVQIDKTVPIRGYNRLMVKTMTDSLQIPHMRYSDEVNMNKILKYREALHGLKLSVLPFAIKAASLALQEYPLLNSTFSLDDMTITYHANHNIGVAMDSPRGLVVPVIKTCQELSILDIAKEFQRLKEAVATESISGDDIGGATFSLSNIGSIGGTYMSPIILAPQVAIGAMGKIQRLPRFVADTMEVEEAHVMNISWGGDHRSLDGATLARFSNRWKTYMENPVSMLFNLK